RLYLASVLGREGAFIAARGGVGEVLPMDLREVFNRAVSSHGDVIEWTSGGVHRFVICGAASGANRLRQGSGESAEALRAKAEARPPQGLAATGPQAAPPQVVDFGKLGPAAGVERVSVTGESWSSDVTNLAATPELKLAPTKITET